MTDEIYGFAAEESSETTKLHQNKKGFFVRVSGTEETNGPFSGKEIIQAIKMGGIKKDDLIRRSSSKNWHRVDEISEVQHVLQRVPIIEKPIQKTKSIPIKWIALSIMILVLVIEAAIWAGDLTSPRLNKMWSGLMGDVAIVGVGLIIVTILIGNIGRGVRCVAQIVSYLKSNIKWGLAQITIGFSKILNKNKKEFVENKVAVTKPKKWYSRRDFRLICAVVAVGLTIILVVGEKTNSIPNSNSIPINNTATNNYGNFSKPPSQGVNDNSLNWDSGYQQVCTVCGRKGGLGYVGYSCHKYFCTYCGADANIGHARKLEWHKDCCILYGSRGDNEIRRSLGSGMLIATSTSTSLGELNLRCTECKTRMPTGGLQQYCSWHDHDCSRYRKR
ncbi:DUF4339 domain-containing protein [PVC group bacterium]|nr:DUF4339 domain-containing protein [PVC group bacterium]